MDAMLACSDWRQCFEAVSGRSGLALLPNDSSIRLRYIGEVTRAGGSLEVADRLRRRVARGVTRLVTSDHSRSPFGFGLTGYCGAYAYVSRVSRHWAVAPLRGRPGDVVATCTGAASKSCSKATLRAGARRQKHHDILRSCSPHRLCQEHFHSTFRNAQGRSPGCSIGRQGCRVPVRTTQ